MNGILIVNKEKNYTSRDVVNIISKQLNTKKVGHTGTLDPMAEGVLVLCIGEDTKLVEILTSNDKEYIAEITLGLKTDTLDTTGNILEEEQVNISKEKIEEVVKSYQKTYEQVVPIYSAVKINGKKLYEYARENEKVELPSRKVTIKKIELLDDIKYANNKIIFKIKCQVSKGTYIRSLVNDIALSLNTIGVMSSLLRTRQGNFRLEDSYTLDEIKKNNYQIISRDKVLENYYSVVMNDEMKLKISNGAIIDNIYQKEIIVFRNLNNNVAAIYKTYEKDPTKLKPWKMFINNI